ncbi:hypothetical protein A2V61_02620 [Candidatus Woesebacteria bacterium RBG_19FT_COMBO_47_8]|uniref:General secretion pathway GspH domain-containing protein n=1 Tax=Candidatus Woesebacteria bacterium RBG_13_46_13 TaxID=1802479 RepID=A0A1F7X3L0_9BACT|nr:MAG: hypothetical protein A2Y68_03460 [Candidatus Woesebacteria bacterium RBG_13_46_13]OGM18107.1 MAG: hypothetical protein A2V61_02620 [Candidatus Woesebacteria bacterium RBG_19FT_COMBO_47_8]HJX59605.1 prepilin-type N-terminal cleavage/methylation domain-containing protein [Patescibacteria group bacterium]
MLKNSYPENGVTFIELLMVVALISILAATTSPFLARFFIQTNLDATVDKVVSTLKKAQSYSMDGKNNVAWGACLDGTNIRLFRGTCGSPSFSEDFSYPSSVGISGFSNVTFSTDRGEPSSTLTITISASTGTKNLILNSAGELDIN